MSKLPVVEPSSGMSLLTRGDGTKPPAPGTRDLLWAHEVATDASPVGVALCDEDGQVLFANPRLSAIFGYAPGELAGTLMSALLPERPGAAHPAERRRFRRPAPGSGREQVGRRKDGSEVPVEVGLQVAIRNGIRLVIASVVDVTELRQLQRQAAERRAFEQVVSDIAVRFVNLPFDQVDETIVDSQRRIVEALDIDRSSLWQFTERDEDMVRTHVWIRPEMPPPPDTLSARDTFPWLLERVRGNEPTWIASLDEIPAQPDRTYLEAMGSQSTALLPLTQGGRVVGALSFGAMRSARTWEPAVRERLRLVAAVFAQALAKRHSEEQLRGALAEVEGLRDRIALDDVQRRSQRAPTAIAAESAAARRVLAQIEQVASTPATVLLLGETGSGKEVFAQAIHDASDRRGRPMVRVNCAAIPSQLLESELFGRERGAYTGALSRQIGRFEMAHGSTLFLDEVGELPLDAQVKLLRVLQERVVERLGGGQPIKIDVRIIAATNRDLARAVADRAFREDLFYRLNVFPVTVPPLRERVEDIPVLVWSFVAEFSKAFNKGIESVSRDDLAALQGCTWAGNVRELRNVIERAVIVADGPHLRIAVPESVPSRSQESVALSDVQIEHIRAVLERARWRVRGPGGAAELLGIKPTTLDSRMVKFGIRRPDRVH